MTTSGPGSLSARWGGGGQPGEKTLESPFLLQPFRTKSTGLTRAQALPASPPPRHHSARDRYPQAHQPSFCAAEPPSLPWPQGLCTCHPHYLESSALLAGHAGLSSTSPPRGQTPTSCHLASKLFHFLKFLVCFLKNRLQWASRGAGTTSVFGCHRVPLNRDQTRAQPTLEMMEGRKAGRREGGRERPYDFASIK